MYINISKNRKITLLSNFEVFDKLILQWMNTWSVILSILLFSIICRIFTIIAMSKCIVYYCIIYIAFSLFEVLSLLIHYFIMTCQ